MTFWSSLAASGRLPDSAMPVAWSKARDANASFRLPLMITSHVTRTASKATPPSTK